ncbi:MAG: hypothetical protein K6T90_22480 [Leptolyngbyaceae cyanobacterium HOT.MB2.61]|nr:hypothetical protein [Leptolyngbyaceae cyanobacterium HOT.MB2.61]
MKTRHSKPLLLFSASPNYSVYLDYKQEEETGDKERNRPDKCLSPSTTIDTKSASPAASEPDPPTKSQTTSKPRKLSFKEKREYEQLETQIPTMEAEKEELEKRLYNDPTTDFAEMQTLTARLAELSEAIDIATERWLELAERES